MGQPIHCQKPKNLQISGKFRRAPCPWAPGPLDLGPWAHGPQTLAHRPWPMGPWPMGPGPRAHGPIFPHPSGWGCSPPSRLGLLAFREKSGPPPPRLVLVLFRSSMAAFRKSVISAACPRYFHGAIPQISHFCSLSPLLPWRHSANQ